MVLSFRYFLFCVKNVFRNTIELLSNFVREENSISKLFASITQFQFHAQFIVKSSLYKDFLANMFSMWNLVIFGFNFIWLNIFIIDLSRNVGSDICFNDFAFKLFNFFHSEVLNVLLSK